MRYVNASIQVIILFCVISCSGSTENTPQDSTANTSSDRIQLKPSDLRSNLGYFRSIISTQNYAYAAVRPSGDSGSGVMIFPLNGLDLLSTGSINEIAFIDLGQRTETLALSGNILFAGGGQGIKALDLSDPESPVELFTLDAHASTVLKIYDQYLFRSSGSVEIFDITDLYNPVSVGLIIGAGFAVTYANNIVYASSITLPTNGQTQDSFENSKIHIIDITDPASPAFMNSIQLSGEAYHLEILNGHLIATVENPNIRTTYLQVYSLSDSIKPILTDELEINAIVRAFGANSNYGVISGYMNGIMFSISPTGKIDILKDIADGSAITPDGFPYHIDVQAEYAIIPGAGYAQITPLQ